MSALQTSRNSFGCSESDRLLLANPGSSQSALEMFECFLDWGKPSSYRCNELVFNSLSSSCATCTFSQISNSAMTCLSRCSQGGSSDVCDTCMSNFLSGWTDACTPQLRSSSIIQSLCASEDSGPFRDNITTQLSTCLAVNETRAIDCMTSNGFPNLPNDCGNCLFASQYITDSVCHGLCRYRPFSGLCQNCINAYVANTIRSCFLLGSYSIISTARCSYTDLGLIGPSKDNVDEVLSQCEESVSCLAGRSGFLIPGKGTVSNSCIQCLSVGETRSGNSCGQFACANITTDCAFSPSIGSLDLLCSLDDLSNFNVNSPLMASINYCLFTSQNRSMETIISCLDSNDNTALNRTLSTNCRSCMSSILANKTSCIATCDKYGNQATPCQECVATSVAFSLSTCFGKANAGVCSLYESTSIAYESWSLGVLQRCLLDNVFSNIPYCMDQAGLGSTNAIVDMSFDCQNCMYLSLLRDSVCPSLCRTNGTDSNECRLCVTNSITGMLQNCTLNASLTGSIIDFRSATHIHSAIIVPLIALIISIL